MYSHTSEINRKTVTNTCGMTFIQSTVAHTVDTNKTNTAVSLIKIINS